MMMFFLSFFVIMFNFIIFVLVELVKFYCFLNYGLIILVISVYNGVCNVMVVVWVMLFDFDLFKVLVVVDSCIFICELIEVLGVFVFNILMCVIVEMMFVVGMLLGWDGDKFDVFGLVMVLVCMIDVLLVEGCVGWLECCVIFELYNEKCYDFFIVEVIVVWVDLVLFSNGCWYFIDVGSKIVYYFVGGVFFEIGDVFIVEVK